jgi:hypothetical protein
MANKPQKKPEANKLLQEFLEGNKMTIIPIPQFVQRDDSTFSVVVKIKAAYTDRQN